MYSFNKPIWVNKNILLYINSCWVSLESMLSFDLIEQDCEPTQWKCFYDACRDLFHLGHNSNLFQFITKSFGFSKNQDPCSCLAKKYLQPRLFLIMHAVLLMHCSKRINCKWWRNDSFRRRLATKAGKGYNWIAFIPTTWRSYLTLRMYARSLL